MTPAHRALPADGVDIRWAPVGDGADHADHVEHLTLRWENEAWTATGRVGRERVEYVVRLSPLWQVRQFLLFRDLDDPDLWLGTDGRGRWGEVNGAHRPELDGAFDLALACTPFTHSLPIRRLPIEVGDAAELSVLQVDVETLAVEPVGARYERRGERSWRATLGSAVFELDVDEHGLPLDVTRDGAPAFRRLP